MQIVDHQNTKIVATVGPASSSYETLLELVKAGVDVFRLNFSHGSHEDHEKVINHITYINDKYGLHIGILADLQGPKLRVGKMKDGGLPIAEGDVLTFVNEPCEGTMEKIYMSYESFARDVKVGERVLVDDGKLELEVLETDKKDTVKLRVVFGGVLHSNKGVNLPNTKISLPCLTEKDLKDLDFILTQPVNWIALSFVRSPGDLKDLQKRIEAKNHPAKIIAKIEKPEAVERIDKIICLGDTVGYGADPQACSERVRSIASVTIVGNHDAAVAGRMDYSYYYEAARNALDMHQSLLTEENLKWLRTLPYEHREQGLAFCHGSPVNLEEFEYIFALDQARQLLPVFDDLARVTFIGHSHLCKSFSFDARDAEEVLKTRFSLAADRKYIVTVGSVGQPRDYDTRACCGVFDTDARSFEYHRVPYDIESAARKIFEADLSVAFGKRLFLGV